MNCTLNGLRKVAWNRHVCPAVNPIVEAIAADTLAPVASNTSNESMHVLKFRPDSLVAVPLIPNTLPSSTA